MMNTKPLEKKSFVVEAIDVIEAQLDRSDAAYLCGSLSLLSMTASRRGSSGMHVGSGCLQI